MAAPHVAGVKALFLAYKYVKPSELADALRLLATPNLIQGLPNNSNNNYILFNAPPKAFNAGKEQNADDTIQKWAGLFHDIGDDRMVQETPVRTRRGNARLRLQDV
jgi:hypothetical protein